MYGTFNRVYRVWFWQICWLNVKTIRQIFFQIMCASQKVLTLRFLCTLIYNMYIQFLKFKTTSLCEIGSHIHTKQLLKFLDEEKHRVLAYTRKVSFSEKATKIWRNLPLSFDITKTWTLHRLSWADSNNIAKWFSHSNLYIKPWEKGVLVWAHFSHDYISLKMI